jgi:GAF domain-containing protein
MADGHRIGTLCVADTEPRRDFGEAECSVLERLAALVMDEFELRTARIHLEDNRERLERQAAELAAAREEAERGHLHLQGHCQLVGLQGARHRAALRL